MTSADGKTWNENVATTPVPSVVQKPDKIAWSSELGLFAAAGVDTIWTSPDGLTWTLAKELFTGNWGRIIWASEIHSFVVVNGDVGGFNYATSGDGVIWKGRYSHVSADAASGVAWSPSLEVLVLGELNDTNPDVTRIPVVQSF